MANQTERTELHKTIWKIANDLRGSVDGWEFKAYVLGSLLLKFAKTIGKKIPNLKYFGQEVNPTTYNLCRINMFLHNVNYDNFDIRLEDTLLKPQRLQLCRAGRHP